jgi:hypothetical protein
VRWATGTLLLSKVLEHGETWLGLEQDDQAVTVVEVDLATRNLRQLLQVVHVVELVVRLAERAVVQFVVVEVAVKLVEKAVVRFVVVEVAVQEHRPLLEHDSSLLVLFPLRPLLTLSSALHCCSRFAKAMLE